MSHVSAVIPCIKNPEKPKSRLLEHPTKKKQRYNREPFLEDVSKAKESAARIWNGEDLFVLGRQAFLLELCNDVVLATVVPCRKISKKLRSPETTNPERSHAIAKNHPRRFSKGKLQRHVPEANYPQDPEDRLPEIKLQKSSADGVAGPTEFSFEVDRRWTKNRFRIV